MNTQEFIKISLKNLKTVSAIIPTLNWVADSIVQKINPGSRCVIEFGPGNGVITRKLLQAMTPEGKILAIEILDEFVREMSKIHDPRLIVIHEDVLKVSPRLRELIANYGADGDAGLADVVISGIPFSFIEKKERFLLIERIRETLKEDGKLIVYQSSPLIFPILKRYFRKVDLSFEPLNIPPYFIMTARK